MERKEEGIRWLMKWRNKEKKIVLVFKKLYKKMLYGLYNLF